MIPRAVPPEGARVQDNIIPGGVSSLLFSVFHKQVVRLKLGIMTQSFVQTTILSTLITIHEDPALFSLPQQFIPERWLGDKATELEKWFVPFSKGPRQCIGMKQVQSKSDRNNTSMTNTSCVMISLAYMELYLTLGNFFGRFEMELFETDEKSMEWVDHGTAVNASSVKVRVKALVF